MTSANYPDDTPIEVRYPLTSDQARGDRATWPWLTGVIEEQCGPDEWAVCVTAREVAVLEDGSPAPEGTADGDLFFPVCFRTADEIRTGA